MNNCCPLFWQEKLISGYGININDKYIISIYKFISGTNIDIIEDNINKTITINSTGGGGDICNQLDNCLEKINQIINNNVDLKFNNYYNKTETDEKLTSKQGNLILSDDHDISDNSIIHTKSFNEKFNNKTDKSYTKYEFFVPFIIGGVSMSSKLELLSPNFCTRNDESNIKYYNFNGLTWPYIKLFKDNIDFRNPDVIWNENEMQLQIIYTGEEELLNCILAIQGVQVKGSS